MGVSYIHPKIASIKSFHSAQSLQNQEIRTMWVCTSLDILIFQKLEAGKSRYRQIAAQHKEARQECRQVIR